MYIEKINIGSFGKLSDRVFELSEGVNIIEGKNESGKSTLSEFIKFVFYGLSGRSVNGAMSERKRHMSWSTNSASGSIVLNDDGKRYRIERRIIPYASGAKEEVNVVDLSSNTFAEGIKNPGEHFFGIPEEVFVSTVYVRQSDGAVFKGEDVGRAVGNIFYSADESVNTEKALKKLDEARVLIKHKKNTGRGLIDALEAEKEELTEKLSAARERNATLMATEDSLGRALGAFEKNKKDVASMAQTLKKCRLHRSICKLDERKKYRIALEGFTEQKNKLIKATSFNGFFPGEDYVSSVKEAKSEIEFIKKSCEAYDDISDVGDRAMYSNELASVIKSMGGSEGIDEKLYNKKRKRKSFIIASAAAWTAAVVFFVLGFLKVALPPIVWLCLGGVGLVLSALFAFSAASASSYLKRILVRFDAEDEEMLFAIIHDIEEKELYNQSRNEIIRFRAVQKADEEKNLEKALSKAHTLLGKWGITVEQKDTGSVIAALESVVSDWDEIKRNLEMFDKEIEKNTEILKLLDIQLSGVSEESVRAEYDGIDCGFDIESEGEVQKRHEFAVKAGEAMTEKIRGLEMTLAELKATVGNPSELHSRLDTVNARINELSLKYDAYVLAYEKLEGAASALRNKLAPGLSAVAGLLMDGLTDGKYKTIGVSDELEMTYTLEDGGNVFTRPIETVSSGTRDLAYVSLRLALADILSKKGGKLPVVFDEAFSRLDETRLKNMLEVVRKYSSLGAQILVMTSRSGEAEIYSSMETEKKPLIINL